MTVGLSRRLEGMSMLPVVVPAVRVIVPVEPVVRLVKALPVILPLPPT